MPRYILLAAVLAFAPVLIVQGQGQGKGKGKAADPPAPPVGMHPHPDQVGVARHVNGDPGRGTDEAGCGPGAKGGGGWSRGPFQMHMLGMSMCSVCPAWTVTDTHGSIIDTDGAVIAGGGKRARRT